MERKVILLVLAVFVILGFGTASLAQQDSPTLQAVKKRGVLRICTALSAPWQFRDPKTNALMGIEIDNGNDVAKQLGVRAEFVVSDWDVLVAGLTTGKCDVLMAGLFVTPVRQEAIDFTIVYSHQGQLFYTIKARTKLNTIDDLNKPDVRYVYGTGTGQKELGEKYLPNANRQGLSLEGRTLLIDVIRANRADVTAGDKILLPAYKAEFKDLKVIPGDEKDINPFDLAWGLRKGDPGWKAYLDNYLRKILDNGIFEQRYKKWDQPKFLRA
jgi:polar amino acid transport system substrate-binding protein